MGIRKPEEVRKVLGILNKEFRYFVRLFTIAEDLKKNAKDRNKRRQAISKFNDLERFESWEQMFAPVNNLKNAVSGMVHLYDPGSVIEIKKLVKQMEIYEAQLLFDTVKRLEPLMIKEPSGQTNWWQQVAPIIDKIIEDLQALVAVDIGLRDGIKAGSTFKGKLTLAHAK